MTETTQTSPKCESLSLSEMLRIMDVATEMRSQRETVEKEFALDETKRLLREKLRQTTTITGERVTDAEVDAAIETYFRTLYTFCEPKRGVELMFAHLYVRRSHLAIVAVLAMTLAGTGWWLMHTTATGFSRTARLSRQAVQLSSSINTDSQRALALAQETIVTEELEQWQREAKAAREQLDTKTLGSINERISNLVERLTEAYEVRILADPDQRSGFTRYFEDENGKRPAYYLIVIAKDDKGQPVRRTIHYAETSQSASVDHWAEQVPKEVYDRIAEDKKSDGILNETLFAVKQRGYRDEEIRLSGADGKPLSRLGTITEW